jgi:serine/threonine protein phosphatase PrpC
VRATTSHPWQSAGRTDIGRLRQSNQDALLLLDDVGCWLVADGMGGHAGGHIASRVAVDTIAHAIQADPARSAETRTKGDDQDRERILSGLIRSANDAVRRHAASDPSLSGMGTTLTVLHFYRHPVPAAIVGHVGDSRIYLLRSNQFLQITQDHSLVEEYRRLGRLSAQEALSHPLRHVLTRAVGPDPDVLPDTFTHRPEPGDRFLLCTDGLTKMLSDRDLLSIVQQAATLEAACQGLVDRANASGGEDNITVVLVQWMG